MFTNKKLEYGWLRLQRKLIDGFVRGNNKEKLLLKNKLSVLRLRSQIQEATLLETFGPYTKGVLFQSYNGNMIGSLSDIQVNQQLGRYGAYNKGEIEALRKCLGKDAVLYVVGTHIGTLLVPLAKHAGKVYGMDANPETFELLKMNTQLNGLYNTEVFSCAVYHENTTLEFYQNTANSGGSKIRPQHDDFRYNYDLKATIHVPAFTLDTLQQQKGWALPDCIIMDIEGAEYFALKGAQTCLQHSKYLYCEFAGNQMGDIANANLDMLLSVIEPHFDQVQIMQELLDGKEKIYYKEEIRVVMQQLTDKKQHADLLFSKSAG